jgi:hypothetical protein
LPTPEETFLEEQRIRLATELAQRDARQRVQAARERYGAGPKINPPGARRMKIKEQSAAFAQLAEEAERRAQDPGLYRWHYWQEFARATAAQGSEAVVTMADGSTRPLAVVKDTVKYDPGHCWLHVERVLEPRDVAE